MLEVSTWHLDSEIILNSLVDGSKCNLIPKIGMIPEFHGDSISERHLSEKIAPLLTDLITASSA